MFDILKKMFRKKPIEEHTHCGTAECCGKCDPTTAEEITSALSVADPVTEPIVDAVIAAKPPRKRKTVAVPATEVAVPKKRGRKPKS